MKTNSEKILKNTLYLYIRSAISLIIKLYIARIILQSLGVESFGVFQLVGGIVAIFSFLNSTFAAGTQRFISYEIGLGNKGDVSRIYSILQNIHIIIGFVVFLLIITIGYILLINYLDVGNIDLRIASIVLLISGLTTMVSIISVPNNSLIIAKEDMNIFALVDLFNVFLQLIGSLLINCLQQNRLVIYSSILLLINIIIRIVYSVVCRKKYKEVHYMFIWDKTLVKEVLGFTSWTSLSAVNYVAKTQGVSVILNIFFGPILNAAMGISMQVNNAVKMFSQNFQMSFMPQIVKKYAMRDFDTMNKIVVSGAKLSTVLIGAFAIPIMIENKMILHLWLGKAPQYSSVIVVLILIETVLQTMTCTSNTAIRATGKIKYFELIYNFVDLFSIPIMILWLRYHKDYYAPFIIIIIFILFSNFVKLLFVKRKIDSFNLWKYIYEVMVKLIVIMFVSSSIPILIKSYWIEGMVRLFISSITFEMIYVVLVGVFALNKDEKTLVINKLNKLIKWKN